MKALLFVLMNVMLGLTSIKTVAITNSSLANSLTGLKRLLQWRTPYYKVDAFSVNSGGSSLFPRRLLCYNHGSNAISKDRTIRHTSLTSSTTRLFVSTDPTRSTDTSKPMTIYVSTNNDTKQRIPKKFVPKPFEVCLTKFEFKRLLLIPLTLVDHLILTRTRKN